MLITEKDLMWMVRECSRRVLSEQQSRIGLAQVLNEIDNAKSYFEKCDVAERYYSMIGRGVDRSVFQIDDAIVLKIGDAIRYGTYGMYTTQNYIEYETWVDSGKSPLLPRILYHAEDYSWIVSEYAVKCEEYDFVNLLGMPLEDKGLNSIDIKAFYGNYNEKDLAYLDKVRVGANPDYSDGLNGPEVYKGIQDRLDSIRNGRDIYDQYHEKGDADEKLKSASGKELSVEDFTEWCLRMVGKVGFARPEFTEEENMAYMKLSMNNPWFHELRRLVDNNEIKDLHIGNFGLVKRNGRECIVIIDAGMAILNNNPF